MHHRLLTSTAVISAAMLFAAFPGRAQEPVLYTPNARDADIESFAEMVGMATKREIVTDPRVRRVRITLVNEKAMTAEEFWQVFEKLLEEQELGLVRTGDIWTVVPASEAPPPTR